MTKLFSNNSNLRYIRTDYKIINNTQLLKNTKKGHFLLAKCIDCLKNKYLCGKNNMNMCSQQ